MIEKVYIPNAIAMMLIITLVSTNGISRRKVLLDSKIFLWMLACNFHQCIGEIVAYAIDGKMLPGFHELGVVVNFMLFVCNIAFSFLWVIYADYKIFENVGRLKKRSRILALPGAVIVLGCIVNLFTPVFYEITQDNVYRRTGLFILPYMVTYFYLTYGTVYIYKHKSQARKYLFMPAVVFMVPIFVGSLVQFFFYGFSTVWVGVATGLVAVYVNMQNEMSCTDALSGLYTRTYMYQYLERQTKRSIKGKLAGIMLDIDDFKKVNDTLGHLTGDDAIRSTGKILLNEMDRNSISVRYGGDEFLILATVQEENEIEELIRRISRAEEIFNTSAGKKYKLHFSTGYSVFEPKTDTMDSFLERMDAAMYETKKAKKNR